MANYRPPRLRFATGEPFVAREYHSMANVAPTALHIASVLSYAASLCAPAFYTAHSPDGCLGLAALISGVFGLFVGFFCWLANPLVLVAWALAIAPKNPWRVVCTATLGAGLCLSFLGHDWVYVDEGGGKAAVVKLGLDYWLWLGAQLLMIVHGVVSVLERRASPPIPGSTCSGGAQS